MSTGPEGTVPTTDGPAVADGSDVVALRAEVAALRAQLADAEAARAPVASAPSRHRVRSLIAVVLIVVGSVLAPVAGVTVFVRNQVLNTDRYVSNVAPLSKNPAIASVVATQVTDQLFTRVRVQSQIEDVLPPKAHFLAGPLTGALKSQTYGIAYRIVLSDRFNSIWLAMNRAVHTNLVGVLTGSGSGSVRADRNGTVTLDLHTLAVNVIRQMDAQGITIFNGLPIDRLDLQIVLLQSAGLVRAQQLTRALDHLALILPVLSILCLLVAIVVSPRHRRAVLWSGLGLAASMAVLAVVLGLARSYLIAASAGHQLTPEAATALFDTLLRYLRDGMRIIFAVGAAMALVAWLVGPARPVVAMRHGIGRSYRWVERGLRDQGWELGGAGRWVADNRGPVQGVLAGLGVVLLIWLTPGIGGALLVIVVTGALVLAVRTIRVKPPGVTADGAGGADGPGGPASGPSGTAAVVPAGTTGTDAPAATG